MANSFIEREDVQLQDLGLKYVEEMKFLEKITPGGNLCKN